MKKLLHKVWKQLQNPRLALSLLVYLILFSVIATLLATTESKTGNISGLYPLINSLRPQLAFFGLDQPYSSPWLIAPALLLTLCTVACSVTRTQVALKRFASIRELRDLDPATLERRGEQIASGALAPGKLDATLREFGLRRMPDAQGDGQDTKRPLVYSRQVWALYASPVFHWILVLMIVIAGVGQLTRAEGEMTLAVGQKLPMSSQYVTLTKKGPLFRFPKQPQVLQVSKVNASLKVKGVERGMTPQVALSSPSGKLIRKQDVYPNSALSTFGLMIHRLDEFNLAADFSLEGTDTGADQLLVPFGFGDATKTFALPGSFELYNPQTGRAVDGTFLLDPAVDEAGNVKPMRLSQAQGTLIVRDADSGQKYLESEIKVGEKKKVIEDLSITLKQVVYTSKLQIVYDWSVWPLYVSFGMALIALSLALLTSPVVAVAGEGADGDTYAYVRIFRPFSYTVQDVYDALAESRREGSEDDE